MRRSVGVTALAAVVAAVTGAAAQQDWSPPSRAMPEMPAASVLAGEWRTALAPWFGASDQPLDGVRAAGEGGARPRLVRFMGGNRPVATWTDRNGDGRADLIEIFRGGAVAYQLIDADYDGHANVLRIYDAAGALAREQRFR
jgi:hypothetical protein